MKTTMNAKRFTQFSLLAAALVLVSACGRYSRTPAQAQFQEEADRVLGNLARQVAVARYGANSRGIRGVTGYQDVCIPGFTVNCSSGFPGGATGTSPMPGFPTQGFPTQGFPTQGYAQQPVPYIADNAKEMNQCLSGTQMISMNNTGSKQHSIAALAMLAQCLDRLLVKSSQQLYAFSFSQMGPQSQQYFQFLLDPRGVNNNPSGMGYNTYQDPLMLSYLFGMNGNSGSWNGGY